MRVPATSPWAESPCAQRLTRPRLEARLGPGAGGQAPCEPSGPPSQEKTTRRSRAIDPEPDLGSSSDPSLPLKVVMLTKPPEPRVQKGTAVTSLMRHSRCSAKDRAFQPPVDLSNSHVEAWGRDGSVSGLPGYQASLREAVRCN